jgi:YbbR domain-containing protein
MAFIKLSVSEQRRLSAFFTCLVLAAGAWIFKELSNPYNFTVKKVLVFKNGPRTRAFHPLQADTVSEMVKGTGWKMLLSKIKNENKPIAVDLSPLDHSSFVVLSAQLKQANDKVADSNIVSFYPDTLYFDFSNRSEKRVPVKLRYNLKYLQQFAQSGNVVIKPSYVVITGPSSRIDKITEWDTDSLLADNVNETVRSYVNLQQSPEGNINITPKAVNVIVPVDEFTEKTVQIPVRLVNNRDYYKVKLFPQDVKVTFITALRKYAETNGDFFEAQSNLDLWRLQGYSALPVALTRFPPFCKIVSVEPRDIDFIVRK